LEIIEQKFAVLCRKQRIIGVLKLIKKFPSVWGKMSENRSREYIGGVRRLYIL